VHAPLEGDVVCLLVGDRELVGGPPIEVHVESSGVEVPVDPQQLVRADQPVQVGALLVRAYVDHIEDGLAMHLLD
jgi:hypothetical protein